MHQPPWQSTCCEQTVSIRGTQRTKARLDSIRTSSHEERGRKTKKWERKRLRAKDGSGVCIVPDRGTKEKQTSEKELKYIGLSWLSKCTERTTSSTYLTVLYRIISDKSSAQIWLVQYQKRQLGNVSFLGRHCLLDLATGLCLATRTDSGATPSLSALCCCKISHFSVLYSYNRAHATSSYGAFSQL